MPARKILVAYWAETQLAFLDLLRDESRSRGVSFSFVPIAHHHRWFTKDRSRFLNALHLSRLCLRIVWRGAGGRLCAFGTNVCRWAFLVSWLFRRVYYVYNELPEHDPRSLLYRLDRLIFRTARHVYVSTPARARYVKELYGLEREPGVLENSAFSRIPELVDQERLDRAIFAGTITPKRFGLDDLDKFRALHQRLGFKVVAYGERRQDIDGVFSEIFELHDQVAHAELLKLLGRFRYGLLAYYRGEPNYELCAPLKLYEYVAAGCTVLSINRNRGLEEIARVYPTLVHFLDGGATARERDEAAFAREREAFLKAALHSNQAFATELLA